MPRANLPILANSLNTLFGKPAKSERHAKRKAALDAIAADCDAALAKQAAGGTAPKTLNGHAVITSVDHARCATVMVHMPENRVTPYCVATWWPELGDRWQWGHYCQTLAEANGQFNEAVNRNRSR